MAAIEFVNTAILLGAGLVLIGILSSLIAARFGAPLLLVFLGIGMVAGEDGPGRIDFADVQLTYMVGSVALALILFDGGLRTRLSGLRGSLAPSLLLATVGVPLTAAITGAIAFLVLPMRPLEALLTGAVTASTDAAAVFYLIRARGLRLRPRVGATLEIESSVNDPMAVFLTLVLVELLTKGGAPTWDFARLLAQEAVIGIVIGVLGGWLASRLLNRITLGHGLLPVFVATSAVTLFGLAMLVGGSGFLAAYLAGLVIGNRPMRAQASVLGFHDALTWLAQIVMFVLLGLLATPHRLVTLAVPGLAIAFTLMLLARPLAVLICLLPFRFSLREIAFLSWMGLRGAVGVFLASIPVLAGLPKASLYFDIGFFVVLVSLLVQGWTVGPVARWLRMALPPEPPPARRIELDIPGQMALELIGFPVVAGAPILSQPLPPWARLVLIARDGTVRAPEKQDAERFKPADFVYLLAPPDRATQLDRLFTKAPATDSSDFFGEFVVGAEARLGSLAELYGLPLPIDRLDRRVADQFAEVFGRTVGIGDRLSLGLVELIARDVQDGRVVRAGLHLTPGGAAPEERALGRRLAHAAGSGWRRGYRRLLRRWTKPASHNPGEGESV